LQKYAPSEKPWWFSPQVPRLGRIRCAGTEARCGILYFFEADEEGWVLRQIELKGPERTPAGAAARAEPPDPRVEVSDALMAYQSKWGGLSDQPITRWDENFPHEEISGEAFDAVWATSRKYLDNKQ
jgi:hypothetical protein